MRERAPRPHGRVQGYRVHDDLSPLSRSDLLVPAAFGDPNVRRWAVETPYTHNNTLYEWGSIVGPLLMRQGVQYGIGGMYMEFENVADPSDAVTPPIITRDPDQGVAYYDALATNPNRDYLRVPLTASLLDSENDNFPLGNLITFFAQSSGTIGVHGKTYSDVANSKVYGGALVAFVDKTDATRDRILSRFVFDVGQQIIKLAPSQIGLKWEYILD